MSKPAVKPIPDGMHSRTPLLICAGAADAIEFYAKAFNALEVSRLPGPEGRPMLAMLWVGNSGPMVADEFPERGWFGPKSPQGSPVTGPLPVDNGGAVGQPAAAAGASVTMAAACLVRGQR